MDAMPATFNRCAPPELMSVLMPGGWAHSLVEYAQSRQYAIDLQCRGYDTKPGHWATLYVGLTKVLDLHYTGKGYRLDVGPPYALKTHGWQPKWARTQSGDSLSEQWSAVEDYLERVIPSVAPRFLKEGGYQTAICAFASQDMVIIDRESVVSFANKAEKGEITKRLAQPLLEAVKVADGAAWQRGCPTSLGGECDALAVTPSGDLLAIEIKPPKATATIPWAPLQVRHYADLFGEWAQSSDSTDKGRAAEILSSMVHQRVELGLAPRAVRPIKRPVRVRPIVALGRGYSPTALARLKVVQQRLIDEGFNDPPLEVRPLSLTGRLGPEL